MSVVAIIGAVDDDGLRYKYRPKVNLRCLSRESWLSGTRTNLVGGFDCMLSRVCVCVRVFVWKKIVIYSLFLQRNDHA